MWENLNSMYKRNKVNQRHFNSIKKQPKIVIKHLNRLKLKLNQ